MKRFAPVLFVLALLLAGAYMTSQSAQAANQQGGDASPPPDGMSPEGSVFRATPDQKISMVVLALLVVVGTFTLGFGLSVLLVRVPHLLQPPASDGTDEREGDSDEGD